MRYIIAGLLLVANAVAVQAQWHEAAADKMGTRIHVHVWGPHSDVAQAHIGAAMREFDRIDAGMSTYVGDSEISRINANAGAAPVPISTELFRLLTRSLALSRLTGGAFDISYDSAGQHYDYRSRVRPDVGTLERAAAIIDYRLVELLPETSSVQFSQPGVRINLGGIAKGHAVESVVAMLRNRGVSAAMVSAGGDSRILGDRQGEPWIVGIRDPDDESGIVTRLAIVDEAISTSGDYERYFDADGVRYHHILNPATGDSARDVRSATVIGPDAVMTDGLSTSLFVMGPADGLALIESLPDFEAIIVDTERGVRFSSGLAPPD